MQSAMPFGRSHQLTAMSSLAGADRATEITKKKIILFQFGQLANLRADDEMLSEQFTRRKSPVLAAFITASVVFSSKLLKRKYKHHVEYEYD